MIGSSSWMAVLGSPLFTASSTFFHWSARSGGVNGLAAMRTVTPIAATKLTEPIRARRVVRVMEDPPAKGYGERTPPFGRGKVILLDGPDGLSLVTNAPGGPARIGWRTRA